MARLHYIWPHGGRRGRGHHARGTLQAVACLLLEPRADIGVEDDQGRTAFQVVDENHEMMKLLSEHNAN
jgi:hypothetical protein